MMRGRHRPTTVATLLLAGLLLAALLTTRCQKQTPASVLVAERCTVCHTLAPIETRRMSAQRWESTVYRMIGLGAHLTSSEAQRVIDYLTTNYGNETP